MWHHIKCAAEAMICVVMPGKCIEDGLNPQVKKKIVMLIYANKKTGKMARWVRLLVARHDSLSSIPGIHLTERENSPELSFVLHLCHGHTCLRPIMLGHAIQGKRLSCKIEGGTGRIVL